MGMYIFRPQEVNRDGQLEATQGQLTTPERWGSLAPSKQE